MTLANEKAALDEGVLIRPRPDLATLVVTGDDRASWLAGMLTNDLASIAPGQASYALSCNRRGRVQADVWVVAEPSRILLGVPRERAEDLVTALDHYLIMEDAEIGPGPGTWWLAHGPRASDAADAAVGAGAVTAMGAYNRWPTAVVVATSAEVDHETLEAALLTPAGAAMSRAEHWEQIRVAHALATFGVDYGDKAHPQEARLETLAVSFDKGCYLGQEAIFMLEKRGTPPRRMVRLALDAPVAVATDLTVDGKRVGTVTTSVTFPEEGPQALATVKTKHTETGTELMAGEVTARVIEPAPPPAGR
ncbi:MAG: folate-binding protein YgfZ [Myxococcota bacterium]